jgi:AAA+ superfamily predicted ATPase
MQIQNHDAVHSETALIRELMKLSDAGGSLIQVRTREPLRVATTLRKHFLLAQPKPTPYREWDLVNGLRSFTTENMLNHVNSKGAQEDFLSALELPLKQLRDQQSTVNQESDVVHFFAYVDPHHFISDNPVAAEYLIQYAAMLPSTNVCLVLITPDVTLKGVPVGTILVADMKTPTADELEELLRATLDDAMVEGNCDPGELPDGVQMTDEEFREISYLGLGLTLYEFETFVAIAVIDAKEAKEAAITVERLRSGVAKGKTEVVRQSDILELISTERMDDVGGMHRLKDWVTDRSDCFTDEAVEFGIEPPKGFALVGVPGTGKSLVAKACGNALGVPVVRLDFGRVFSKFIGDSESRVRSALTMVENMAPVVLFVDEIDKGLGGSGGGGGDGGTSSRVLGSFLTWLQENKAKVFTIVTANRVTGLPPELLRRGRFDAIFSIGLPNADEREEVLRIHLRKRGHDIDELGDLTEFRAVSDRYVPAEIESAVKDGLIAAFKTKKLTMGHILQALRDMVPMSRSHAESINGMIAWAAENATPVNYPEGQATKGKAPVAIVGGKQVVRTAPQRRIRRG